MSNSVVDTLLDNSHVYLNNGLQQGDYLVGPQVNFCSHPVKDISEYVAKKDDSNDYVILKVLDCKDEGNSQGKALLHNEHLILSLLQDKPGVIHHHGLFKHSTKFILVLDCLIMHEFKNETSYKEYINLQQYVIQKKQLNSLEALHIFCSIISTLKDLHQNNIVHRDLKLGNLVYNKRNKDVTMINFALSKHLVRDDEMLSDQCGSLAYVSPEILSGKAYDGKASDMWAMGILLYTMVCGQFPFYDSDRTELFKKIRSSDFIIPNFSSDELHCTFELVKMLIVQDPAKRLTAVQALEVSQQHLMRLLNPQSLTEHTCEIQVVPMEDSKNTCYADSVVPDGKLKFAETFPFTTGTNLESFVYLSSESIPQMSPRHQPVSTPLSTSRPNRTSLPTISRFSPLHRVDHDIRSITTKIVSSAQQPRQRRNSSGSETRFRRHSTAAIRTTAHSRQRRRSHDVRDEQADILDRLRIAATINRVSSHRTES